MIFATEVAGMDSSRSGLLSTFLMTLPLIIVPAIALLRPPGQTSGISDTVAQGADSTEFEFPAESDGLFAGDEDEKKPGPREPRSTDEEFSFSEEIPLTDAPPAKSRPRRTPDAESDDTSDIFAETPAPTDEVGSRDNRSGAESRGKSKPPVQPEAVDQSNPIGPDSEIIVRQLNAMGAIRTMWFDASETAPVGFAAFFRGDTELMRYRFEAVGQTRAECAEDVLQQVTAWRQAAAQK